MNKALKIVLPLAAIGVAVIISVLLFISSPKIEHKAIEIKQPQVSVLPVYSKALSIPVSARGTVTPGTEIQLNSEVSGQVLSVSNHFANGGFFKKGEVLITIDPIEYEANISRAKANVAKAKEAELRASAEYRARNRVKGVKRDSYALGKSQWDQAKASLQAARAELQSAELQKKRTLVRAPFDGRVRMKSVDVGQYIRPGIVMGTIYAVDVAEVRLPLSDRQLALVDVQLRYQESTEFEGTPVLLKGQYGGKPYVWEGRIVRSEGGLDEKNRLLYVVARIENPYARDENQPDRPPLSAGTFVEAQIAGRYHQGVFTVPRRALRNGSQLWLVDADKRLVRREVDVIYKGKDEIYVNGGLKDGDQIVLSQLDIAVKGMRVRTKIFVPDPLLDAPGGVNDLMSKAVKRRENNIMKAMADQIPVQDRQAVKAAATAAIGKMLDSTPQQRKDMIKDITQAVTETAAKAQDIVQEPAASAPDKGAMSPLAALIAEDEAAQASKENASVTPKVEPKARPIAVSSSGLVIAPQPLAEAIR